MFEDFDFSALDDPSFKEDSVREEIIAPLLRALGYKPTGPLRVVRSKSLTHPFVLIGSRRYPVNIIPDYTLWHGDQAILVIDAKAPNQSIVRSDHVEQAYSYAIHPEVRAWHYALCNGRELALYDIGHSKPAFVIATSEIDARWAEVENYLAPAHLLDPNQRHFQPDLGMAMSRIGMPADCEHIFLGCRLQHICRVNDDLYTAASACDFLDSRYLASFDFAIEVLRKLLACLPDYLETKAHDALHRAPFQFVAGEMIEVDWVTRLGEQTRGQHDKFVPFVVTEVSDSRFTTEPPQLETVDVVPPFVFHLRRAWLAHDEPPIWTPPVKVDL